MVERWARRQVERALIPDEREPAALVASTQRLGRAGKSEPLSWREWSPKRPAGREVARDEAIPAGRVESLGSHGSTSPARTACRQVVPMMRKQGHPPVVHKNTYDLQDSRHNSVLFGHVLRD